MTPQRDMSARFILTAIGAPDLVAHQGRVRAGYIIGSRSPNERMLEAIYGAVGRDDEQCRYAEPGEVLYAPAFDGLGPGYLLELQDFDDFAIMSKNFAFTLLREVSWC